MNTATKNRIEAAIRRAANKYCRSFTATVGETVVPIVAVKTPAGENVVDAGNSVFSRGDSMNVTIGARLFQFLLAPSSFDAILSAAGGSRLDRKLDAIRRVVLREYDGENLVAEFRINASKPLEDVGVDAVMLYAYQSQG